MKVSLASAIQRTRGVFQNKNMLKKSMTLHEAINGKEAAEYLKKAIAINSSDPLEETIITDSRAGRILCEAIHGIKRTEEIFGK